MNTNNKRLAKFKEILEKLQTKLKSSKDDKEATKHLLKLPLQLKSLFGPKDWPVLAVPCSLLSYHR